MYPVLEKGDLPGFPKCVIHKVEVHVNDGMGNQLQVLPELIDGDPGLKKNCLKRLWCEGPSGVHGNGDDNITLRMIETVVAAPNTGHLKAGILEGTDHLLPGGSRDFHVPVLLVFRDTDTSTGIGLPRFLVTSKDPAIASSMCESASSRVDPSLMHPGRDGTVMVYPPSSFRSIRAV